MPGMCFGNCFEGNCLSFAFWLEFWIEFCFFVKFWKYSMLYSSKFFKTNSIGFSWVFILEFCPRWPKDKSDSCCTCFYIHFINSVPEIHPHFGLWPCQCSIFFLLDFCYKINGKLCQLASFWSLVSFVLCTRSRTSWRIWTYHSNLPYSLLGPLF